MAGHSQARASCQKMEAALAPTVALVPHAQAFAVSAVGLALFVTNNALAIAPVRDPEEARSARGTTEQALLAAVAQLFPNLTPVERPADRDGRGGAARIAAAFRIAPGQRETSNGNRKGFPGNRSSALTNTPTPPRPLHP